MTGVWGEGLIAIADAVGVALFGPRCAGCGAWQNARPRLGLCAVCVEVLEPNVGARCTGCDVPWAGDAPLCRRCLREPPPFDALRAPLLYGGPIAQVVTAAKFAGREDLAAALGELIAADDAARALTQQAIVVPVPLGPRRARARGYNVPAVMARVLGRRWGRPVIHALRRARETRPQTRLELEARRANVADAFVVRRPLDGRATVALVDDVVTSTETTRQCAQALKAAGAPRVVVLAAARAET